MLTMSKGGQKGIALLLFTAIVLVSVIMSFPAHGIAAETVIISGIIAAMMVSLGVELVNVAGGFDQVTQTIYDGWTQFASTNNYNDSDILDNVQIYNNKLYLANSSAIIMQDYCSTMENNTTSLGYTCNVNGNRIDVPNRGVQGTMYPFDTGVSVLCDDGYYHTYVVKYVRDVTQELYIDGVQQPFSNQTARGQYLQGWSLARDNTNKFIQTYKDDGFDYLIIHYLNSGELNPKFDNAYLSQSIDDRSLADISDKAVALTIESTEPIATVETFAENAIQTLVSDGTLDSEIETNKAYPTDVPSDNTMGSVTIEGEVTIAEAALPNIDDISWGDIPALLTNVFPFSIPWDVKAGLECLRSPAVPPVWTITIPEMAGIEEQEITIDLTDSVWNKCFEFVRWACIILWCAGLAVSSSKLIWGSD